MNTSKEKNFVSAVIYVHNQEKTIFDFLKEIDMTLKEHFEKYEIICVNDASSDGSVQEIKRYASGALGEVISIINMSFFQGMEMAMNAGVDLSIGDFVYEFDSLDREYPIKLIFELYLHSLKGYDIVSAAPNNRRKVRSTMFYGIFNRASKTQYALRTEAFRILSRRAINRVQAMSITIPYRKAVYANCGLKLDVLTYEKKNFAEIQDRETKEMQADTAVDAMILYTDLAYKLSIGFLSLMILITAFAGVYTIFIYLSGQPIAGWTTTMLFLSFAFMGIFVILTIVIKYISVLLKLNFNKQKYIVESIEKLSK